MIAYVVQPYYSCEENDIQSCFYGMLSLLDTVSEDADIIVLPEYCDVPAACGSKKVFHSSLEKYNRVIKEAAQSVAKRCHAIVFFNAADKTPSGWRNTTYAINRDGEVVENIIRLIRRQARSNANARVGMSLM